LVPVVEVIRPNSPAKVEMPKVYKISFQVSKAGPVKIERIVSETENETPIDLRIMKQTLAIAKRSYYQGYGKLNNPKDLL
jgi:hypothetical protein